MNHTCHEMRWKLYARDAWPAKARACVGKNSLDIFWRILRRSMARHGESGDSHSCHSSTALTTAWDPGTEAACIQTCQVPLRVTTPPPKKKKNGKADLHQAFHWQNDNQKTQELEADPGAVGQVASDSFKSIIRIQNRKKYNIYIYIYIYYVYIYIYHIIMYRVQLKMLQRAIWMHARRFAHRERERKKERLSCIDPSGSLSLSLYLCLCISVQYLCVSLPLSLSLCLSFSIHLFIHVHIIPYLSNLSIIQSIHPSK